MEKPPESWGCWALRLTFAASFLFPPMKVASMYYGGLDTTPPAPGFAALLLGAVLAICIYRSVRVVMAD